VFYLRYLGSELLRRRGRTILTVLGLAVGVGLVIVISALTRGLEHAQATALNPLTSIGTDLTVTSQASQDAADSGGPGGGGPGGGEVVDANRSVITDLSKLGKPGTHFVHDFFLPGTQLAFPQSQTKQIAQIDGVGAASSGLTLLATHQEGVVPKIVAKVQTGGQTFDIRRDFKPPTATELAKIQACIEKAGGTTQGQGNGQGGLGQTPPGGGGGGLGGGFGIGGGAFQKCLPGRFQRLRARFTTPRETLRQVVAPPQTNITTKPYTIGGVDQRHPALALVTPRQVRQGRYLHPAGGREALVATAYAANNDLHVGSTLDLNGTSYRIVGLIEPPLGGQSADVYLPLAELQKLAGLVGRVNVALVRATDSASVDDVQKQIESTFPSATVESSKQVTDTINGSLVDAADLSKTLGLALSIIAACAAFLLAALLTLSSVGKRVRELGTLKAIGWRQRLVVRQIVAESLTQGAAGGLLGIVIGVAAAAALGAFGPTLTATSATGGSLFGVDLAHSVSRQVSLSAPLSPSILALGLGIALLGGALAGAAGAFRAARLRPADAMRQVE
jgi:putative ABC transport system permease protein